MSSNKKSNIPMNKSDPELVTTWHGRLSPTTRERPVTYTLGTRSNSPMFTSIDDLRKAKREIRLDPHSDSPLPDIFKTPRGETPTMDEIMPKLEEMKQGWGEKRSKSPRNDGQKTSKSNKGGRVTKKNKKRRKSTKSKKSRKKRKYKKTKK